MIKAIFCTNSKPGSLLISWGTKRNGQSIEDTPSHVAFLFFENIVIDSTLTKGVSESTYEKIDKKYKIIKQIDLDITESSTYRFLEKARAMIIGSGYDWPGILYYSYRVLLFKLFKTPIPVKNKLAVPRLHFCTEVMSIIDGNDYSIVSPNDLMLLLKEKGYKIASKDFNNDFSES